MAVAGKKKKIFDNRYEILSIVGRGSRSVVYRARHVGGKQQEVALKILLAKKGLAPTTDQLRKEALAMVSSRHKYVIRLDDFHSVGDLCYLSMEYAAEGDLRQYSERLGGKLTPTQSELFLLQAAEALDFIHKAGILHRDIKPENLLVIDQQNIRLGDFGVAILPGEVSSLEELQRGVGTMSYMSPEVLSGAPYDRRSDIYALAVTMYEMLSGVHPFEGVPLAEQVARRRTSQIPPLSTLVPNIPEHLSAAIMRAMEYSATKRFQSCREFIQGILQIKAKNLSERAKEGKRVESDTAKRPVKPKPLPKASVKKVPIDEPRQREQGEEEDSLVESKSSRRSRRRKQKKQRDQSLQQNERVKPQQEPAQPVAKKNVGRIVNLDQSKRKKPEEREAQPKEKLETSQKLEQKKVPQPEAKKVSEPKTNSSPKEKREFPHVNVPQATQHDHSKSVSDGARLADQMRKLVEGHMQAPEQPKRPIPPIGLRGNQAGTREKEPEVAPPVANADQPSVVEKRSERDTQKTQRVPQPTSSLVSQALRQPMAEPSEKRPSRSERTPGAASSIVEEAPSRLSQVPKRKKSNRRKGGLFSQITAPQLILVTVGSLFLLYLTTGLFDSDKPSVQYETVTADTAGAPAADELLLSVPFVGAEALSFPQLKQGSYTGYLLARGSEQKVPLSLISFAEAGEIIAIVGIHGWSPARIPYPQSGARQALLFQSSGMLVELTLASEPRADELVGLYKNLVTGEEGEWRLVPLRGERK